MHVMVPRQSIAKFLEPKLVCHPNAVGGRCETSQQFARLYLLRIEREGNRVAVECSFRNKRLKMIIPSDRVKLCFGFGTAHRFLQSDNDKKSPDCRHRR